MRIRVLSQILPCISGGSPAETPEVSANGDAPSGDRKRRRGVGGQCLGSWGWCGLRAGRTSRSEVLGIFARALIPSVYAGAHSRCHLQQSDREYCDREAVHNGDYDETSPIPPFALHISGSHGCRLESPT